MTTGKNPSISRVLDEFLLNIPRGFRENYVVVIFEYNKVSEFIEPYKKLLDYGLDKIIIINQSNILCVSKSYWKSYIPDSLNQIMIEKAKRKIEEIRLESF